MSISKWTLDSVREGEGGMIWESSTETHTSPHVKEVTSASRMHEAGHWKPVFCDNQGAGVGREAGGGIQDGRTHVHPWPIHADVWQNHHNIVK